MNDHNELEEYCWQESDYTDEPLLLKEYPPTIYRNSGQCDRVVFWLSGENEGIYAIGEISEPRVFSKKIDADKTQYYRLSSIETTKYCIKVRILAKFIDQPITKEECDDDPVLEGLKSPYGDAYSTYSIHGAKWGQILSILRTRNIPIKDSIDELLVLKKSRLLRFFLLK
jgi:hypothetical protein